MYKRVRLRDTVEVPPAHLAEVTPELVKRLLQDNLEGRMDEDVGSVVSVIEVHDVGEGAVVPGEEAAAASVGRDLAERCRTIGTTESYADDAIVELAREGSVDYVVTNDKPLRDRVLDADVPVIGLRGKNKLAVTQP